MGQATPAPCPPCPPCTPCPVSSSATTQVPTDAAWSAELSLGFRPGSGRTVLAERRRCGPLAVQRPFYPEGEVCHVYLLHPPGGVVGGDSLAIQANLAAASQALLTTPGATKFYRSAGAWAQQQQRLCIQDGGSLEYLPQENILFPGAKVKMLTRVDLQGDARLALWETQCLGRPVIDEAFDEGVLDSRLEIWRDGRPLLLERLRVDAASRLYPSTLAGQPVSATAIFSAATAEHLQYVRTLPFAVDEGRLGMTLVEDLLLIRYLGPSTEQANRCFTRIWSDLRQSLLGRQASAPRIWNT